MERTIIREEYIVVQSERNFANYWYKAAHENIKTCMREENAGGGDLNS